jgi:hypothetical protein
VDALLQAWLNAIQTGGVSSYECPKRVTLEMPRITEDGITYEDAPIRFQPYSVLPILGLEEDLGLLPLLRKVQETQRFTNGLDVTVPHRVWSHWPPKGWACSPISPEAESAELYGPLERVEEEGKAVVVSQRDPSVRGLHILLHWRYPLTALLPFGGGLDVLLAQPKMVAIAERSTKDPEGARQEAREAAGPYLSVGVTTHELSWFMPTLTALRHTVNERTPRDTAQERSSGGFHWELAFDLARERFGLETHDYVQAVQSGEWDRKMRAPIPIKRAYGVVGLFWALLLNRLEASQPFHPCERCYYILEGKRRGKKAKQVCGPHDNKGCYHQRKAEAMRHSRARQ